MADASDDELWELDQSALDALAKAEAAVKQNPQLARASSSRAVVNNGDPVRLQQRDLFGNTIKPVVAANTSRAFSSLSNTSNALAGPSRLANGQTAAAAAGPVRDRVNAVVRKRWDRTIHAKSGAVSKSKGVAAGRYGSSSKTAGAARNTKGKGKARAYGNDYADDYDEEEDADVDEEDGPADQDSGDEGEAAPKQMKLSPDREACKTFVYPLNKPLRKYQYDIVTKAFYTDTLVALPTGLGKTFLAAVLMLNFYRWFPEGKIIFMAPTRPLVTQQIQACHGIAGIPLRDAVEMTGKDAPERREEEWRRRRIFYCTPQTVKNDLVKKRLNPSDIVCLVVDEAHRATGDYGESRCLLLSPGAPRRVFTLNRAGPRLSLHRSHTLHDAPQPVLQGARTDSNSRWQRRGGAGGRGQPSCKNDASVFTTLFHFLAEFPSVRCQLQIGHIEVRTDESLDIRQYIHKKVRRKRLERTLQSRCAIAWSRMLTADVATCTESRSDPDTGRRRDRQHPGQVHHAHEHPARPAAESWNRPHKQVGPHHDASLHLPDGRRRGLEERQELRSRGPGLSRAHVPSSRQASRPIRDGIQ